MVATFILTRTFAIAAFMVGALSPAYAAPVVSPRDSVDTTSHAKRWCRQMGCLVEIPPEASSTGFPEASSTGFPAATQLTYASMPTSAVSEPESGKEESTAPLESFAEDGAEAVFDVNPVAEDA
ncbi:hypothetical protein C8Q73DRAFT_793586 [Cubamyces lactineus]|nr:hypothetical protein C8Q73DRAFT_793586 [Cubamyces lactineus]